MVKKQTTDKHMFHKNKECVICGKKYIIKVSDNKTRSLMNIFNQKNAITCGRLCSRRFTKISDRIRARYFSRGKRAKNRLIREGRLSALADVEKICKGHYKGHNSCWFASAWFCWKIKQEIARLKSEEGK